LKKIKEKKANGVAKQKQKKYEKKKTNKNNALTKANDIHKAVLIFLLECVNINVFS